MQCNVMQCTGDSLKVLRQAFAGGNVSCGAILKHAWRCRLLSSFHTTVDEITIIATPENLLEPGQASKTVQIHSYQDTSKGVTLPLHSHCPCRSQLPKPLTFYMLVLLIIVNAVGDAQHQPRCLALSPF